MNSWVLITMQGTIIGALLLFLISRKSRRTSPSQTSKITKIDTKTETRADTLKRACQFPAVRQAARHWADDLAQRLKNHPEGWVRLQVGRTDQDGLPLTKHALLEQYEALLLPEIAELVADGHWMPYIDDNQRWVTKYMKSERGRSTIISAQGALPVNSQEWMLPWAAAYMSS